MLVDKLLLQLDIVLVDNLFGQVLQTSAEVVPQLRLRSDLHVGDDGDVAGADPEVGQHVLHVLRLHVRLHVTREDGEHVGLPFELLRAEGEHPEFAFGKLLPALEYQVPRLDLLNLRSE